MKRLTITLLALAITLGALPTAFGDEAPVDIKKMLKEFKAAMKSKDPAERKAAVAAVSAAKDPDIAKALSKYLHDRDPEVQAAVCRAVGAQGDLRAGARLLPMLARAENDPDLLVAVCDGLAGVPTPRAIGPLEDIVKNVFNKLENPEVGKAAIRALGAIRHKSAVDPLITIAERTNPQTAGGDRATSISQETRQFLKSFRPDVVAALCNITGLSYNSPTIWVRWWKDHERGYRVPDGPIDLSTISTFRDAGYRFEISLPADSWKFSELTGDTGIIRVGHPEEGNEATSDARVEIHAWHISDFSTKTVAERVLYWDDWAEKQFRDIKEMTTRETRFNGEKASEWYAKGLYGGSPKEMRRIIMIRKDVFFEIRTYAKTSIPDALRDDLDKVVSSIRFF